MNSALCRTACAPFSLPLSHSQYKSFLRAYKVIYQWLLILVYFLSSLGFLFFIILCEAFFAYAENFISTKCINIYTVMKVMKRI